MTLLSKQTSPVHAVEHASGQEMTTLDPVEEILKARQVAHFLWFVTSSLAFHQNANEMAAEDLYGLSQIMKDITDRLAWSEEAVIAEREKAEVETLRRVGAPEHALADRRLRRAWRDGYAHALANSA